MLPDLERKLLRILYSYSTQRKRMPTIDELEIKTGRNKQDIFAGLRGWWSSGISSGRTIPDWIR